MADKEIIAVIEQRATHVGVPRLRIPTAMLMQIVNFDAVEDWEPDEYSDEERAQMKLWNVRVIIEAEEVKAPGSKENAG